MAGKGKLAELARESGLTLRDFLLKEGAKVEGASELAKSLDVSYQRVRIDMARCGLAEVRTFKQGGDSSTYETNIIFVPIEAISGQFVPVAAG